MRSRFEPTPAELGPGLVGVGWRYLEEEIESIADLCQLSIDLPDGLDHTVTPERLIVRRTVRGSMAREVVGGPLERPREALVEGSPDERQALARRGVSKDRSDFDSERVTAEDPSSVGSHDGGQPGWPDARLRGDLHRREFALDPHLSQCPFEDVDGRREFASPGSDDAEAGPPRGAFGRSWLLRSGPELDDQEGAKALRQRAGDTFGESGNTRVGAPIAAGQDVGCLPDGEPFGIGVVPIGRAAIDDDKREWPIDVDAPPGRDLAAQRLAFLHPPAGGGHETL